MEAARGGSSSGTEDSGSRVVLLSPLEVHFSQTRIRAEFQDGRALPDTTTEIEAVPYQPSSSSSSSSAPLAESSGEAASGEGEMIFLRAPFPPIEVTKWRCKLRDSDGAPKVDAATGQQLYSEEEHWFTFDNRRLCCLQRAAAAVWPKQALCEVVDIPQTVARFKELRKFDTKTGGYSVIVGRRDAENNENWCWRSAVGLPAAAQPEGGVARQQVRWRGHNRGGRGKVSRKDIWRGGEGGGQEEEERGSPGAEFVRSMALFLLVYLVLRMGMWAVRDYWYGSTSGGSGSGSGSPTQPSG